MFLHNQGLNELYNAIIRQVRVVFFLSSSSKLSIQSFISVAFRLLIKMKPLIFTFPAMLILLVAFSLEVRCISKTFQQKSREEKRSLPNLPSEDFFKGKNKLSTGSSGLIKGGWISEVIFYLVPSSNKCTKLLSSQTLFMIGWKFGGRWFDTFFENGTKENKSEMVFVLYVRCSDILKIFGILW